MPNTLDKLVAVPASPILLSSKQYVTLVLRLVLNKQDRLDHGELIDLSGKNEGRFNNWEGLVHVLEVWLSGQEKGKLP